MMSKSFFLVSLAFAFAPVQAALGNGNVPWTLARISSSDCSAKSTLISTSGWAFRFNENTYVVSSQSAVRQSADCVTVSRSGSAPLSARTVAWDWGKGLLLLALPQGSWPDAVPLGPDTLQNHAISSASLKVDDPLVLGGFPSSSAGKDIDANGVVLLPRSGRNQFALLPSAIEVQGDAMKIESAMVGGPAWTPDGELAGLISDQYIQMTLGTSAVPKIWDHVQGHVENHVLLIPSESLLSWLQATLVDDGSFAPPLLAVADPANSTFNVDSTGFGFEFACPTSHPAKAASGKLASAKVGGGDRGGGDGGGVGGNSSDARGACSVTLTPRHHPADAVAPWPFPDRRDWSGRVSHFLSLGLGQTLGIFAYLDLDTQAVLPAYFHSPSEFFKLLGDSRLSPVTHVAGDGELVSEALQAARESSLEVNGLVSHAVLPQPEFTAEVAFLDTLLQSYDAWNLVHSPDIDALTESSQYELFWDLNSASDSAIPDPNAHFVPNLLRKISDLRDKVNLLSPPERAR